MSTAMAPPPTPAAPEQRGIGDYARERLTSLRQGELGSLPIIVGLIVIAIIFQTQNDRFLTAGNFVNLIVQSAAIITIAMMISPRTMGSEPRSPDRTPDHQPRT